MKRILAVALLLSGSAWAQFGASAHIPPSVTSGGHRGGGIAPSVTSLPPSTPYWGFDVRFGRNPRVHIGGGNYPPPVVYYPYPYPVYPVVYAAPQPTVVVVEREREAEPPAMTVFERRPVQALPDEDASRYGEGYLDGRERRPAAVPRAQVIEVVDQPRTLLIFRDGKRLEISNYAIMGGTLINLGDGPRRIELASLDLPATEKANEDRGVDFRVPR